MDGELERCCARTWLKKRAAGRRPHRDSRSSSHPKPHTAKGAKTGGPAGGGSETRTRARLRAIRRAKRNPGAAAKRRSRNWIDALPLKMRFRVSGLYISVIPPLLVGLFVGVLSAIMGVGGGFIMVPAMIYLLGMPTKVVVGTSLFQIIFVTAFTTMLHATTNYTVDIVLAMLLLVGGVVGAQFGTQIGMKLKAEQLRILLAALVLGVCIKLALELLIMPSEVYSLSPVLGAN